MGQGVGVITVMLVAALSGTTERGESQAVHDAGHPLSWRKRENAGMEIEQLEQIAAVIVTAGLVAGNFVMFTPWRNGEDPRQRTPVHSIQKSKR